MERGTEVNCGPRAIITVRAGRLYSLDWTGLTQKSVRCLFQCRTEAKHTYLFAKVACIACFRVFPRVGRGQRSRAYLMSSSKMRFSQSWMIVEYYFLFSYASAKGWSSMSVVNKCSSNLSLKLIKYAREL